MSNEIKLTRLYAATPAAVWAAWVDPAQVGQWWGPRGFVTTTKSKDVRTGGTWVYDMRGPDGQEYPNKTVYLEVEPGVRMVYDHGGNDDRPPLFRVTVSFAAAGEGTRMDMSMRLPTPEMARETRMFIKAVGGDTTWDRLAEFLAKKQSGREVFVINRELDAPVAQVQRMWTDPEILPRWLPPAGFKMRWLKCDLRSGGSASYVMANDAGAAMYGRSSYELIVPGRVTYKQVFCDEHGNVSRHPFAPTWPETLWCEVTFVEVSQGRTLVTITAEPRGEVSPTEMATFTGARAGMSKGWSGSFDALEAELAK